MVSFTNGSLSGLVSNKRPLENGYVLKYKPRKVSAIRDFPPGCGGSAVPLNLKPVENSVDGARIMDAVGIKKSEMTNTMFTNVVGISKMADDLVESEAVGNSEMANKIEADGAKTAEMSNPLELNEIRSSEIQNDAGSGGVEGSNLKVECQSDEAANSIVDVDINETLDALVDRVMLNANVIEKLVIGNGLVDIQLPNEVECHRNVVVNNPIEVERAESLDTLVGNVTTTVMDDFSKDSDELIAETKSIGFDTLRDMISDSSKAGDQTKLKELNVVEDLPLFQSSGVEDAKSMLYADTYDKELLLGNSQGLSSIRGSTKLESSIKPKDKYRLRRVFAVRDFPPHCGRNALLPIDEEKRMVTSGHDRLDGMEKVEMVPHVTMPKNVSKEETTEKMQTTCQAECPDGIGKVNVKKETAEAVNDCAGRGPLAEIVKATVEGGLMDFEESNEGIQHSIVEKKGARQDVPGSGNTSKAMDDTTIDDTGAPLGKEIAICSPSKYSKERPPDSGFSLVNEPHREIVHGLMAAPNCPWRKLKVAINNSDGRKSGLKGRQSKMSRPQKSKAVALDNNLEADSSGGPSLKKTAFPDSCDGDGIPGSLTFNEEARGVHDGQVVLEVTPISMYQASPENSDRDSAEPVRKDGGSSEGKKRKRNFSWRREGKAVARKSSPKVNLSGLPSKKQHEVHTSNDVNESPGALMLIDDEDHDHDRDFPTKSLLSHKQKVFEVVAPPFGLKSSGHGDVRNRVRETLRLFHAICRKLLQQEEANSMPEEEGKLKQRGKKPKRIDLLASKAIKEQGKEVNTEKQILGQVPGVEVGDEFQYRVELVVVGIHRLFQAGIDWLKLNNGVPVATSIISSGAYADDVENADTLIYSGQGGNVIGKTKQPEDQKLEKGNLALRNSISAQTPVRVVRGWKETKAVDPLDPKPKTVTTYVYDGLYTVTNYWTETGRHGKQVFMFELKRNPGQPELAWKQLKKSSKSKFRPGVCVSDISGGKEPFAICAVNTSDEEKPPPFNYVSKMLYPDWYHPKPPAGCDCAGRCSDSKKCRCAVRNGGEIPYNRNGALVETKPLVYECGPHCKCPPSCYNRVTQRGIKFQLEIFKTESRGWGVRPLTSIPSGSFICEYAGELLEDKEAEQRIGSDEYLFDIGQNYNDYPLKPGEQPISVEHTEESGYTIDAALYGNIGRFINHSCLPNLHAQNVIYDHDDRKMPHVMLFAMENIPPLQELTYHYNYSVGQIRDSNGEIKVKKCYCGTAECTGRMY